jgi:hypothetical protein
MAIERRSLKSRGCRTCYARATMRLGLVVLCLLSTRAFADASTPVEVVQLGSLCPKRKCTMRSLELRGEGSVRSALLLETRSSRPAIGDDGSRERVRTIRLALERRTGWLVTSPLATLVDNPENHSSEATLESGVVRQDASTVRWSWAATTRWVDLCGDRSGDRRESWSVILRLGPSGLQQGTPQLLDHQESSRSISKDLGIERK